MAGQGWVRVDPTAAVAPARTGSLQRLLPPRGVIAQALGAMSPGFELNLRAFWEATNNRWNQWVLNYSQARQLKLLQNLGIDTPSWEDLGMLLLACIVAASLVGVAWTQWERLRQDPWLRLLHSAQRQMQKAGFAVQAHMPPRQLAQLLQSPGAGNASAASGPPAAGAAERERLQDWLLRLEAWRYAAPAPGDASARAGLGTLRRELRQLRWPQQTNP
jgi:hypothetical protein